MVIYKIGVVAFMLLIISGAIYIGLKQQKEYE
jgi:hypothetical protein